MWTNCFNLTTAQNMRGLQLTVNLVDDIDDLIVNLELLKITIHEILYISVKQDSVSSSCNMLASEDLL